MAKIVENKMCNCSTCGHSTMHHRNINKMGAGEGLIHLILVVVTMGVWLMALIPFMLFRNLTNPVWGGWVCSKCGNK